jgi:uncharacterized protein YjbI with pentapeptide repeats
VANTEQLAVLAQGLEAWNDWRAARPREPVDLSGADLRTLAFGLFPALSRADARGLIPAGASLSFIYNEIVGVEVMPLNLREANLRYARLDNADLAKADCQGADFSGAKLNGTNLHRADCAFARFVGADLSGADLRAADLRHTLFIGATVEDTDLGYADVHGASVWGLKGVPADETDLLVTSDGEQALRCDSFALAQLIYFLTRGENTRELIDTVSNRLVLILGNFKHERMAVLTAVRTALRSIGCMPIIFDFDGPRTTDTTGTVETLARLSHFVMADLTDPSSVPHELATTVPFLRTTPVVLLRAKGATGYSMVRDLKAYPWVQGVHDYEGVAPLVGALPEIVGNARALAERLRTQTQT